MMQPAQQKPAALHAMAQALTAASSAVAILQGILAEAENGQVEPETNPITTVAQLLSTASSRMAPAVAIVLPILATRNPAQAFAMRAVLAEYQNFADSYSFRLQQIQAAGGEQEVG